MKARTLLMILILVSLVGILIITIVNMENPHTSTLYIGEIVAIVGFLLLVGVIGLIILTIRSMVNRRKAKDAAKKASLPSEQIVESDIRFGKEIGRMNEPTEAEGEVAQETAGMNEPTETEGEVAQETAQNWQPYWQLVGWGAPLLWAIGVGFIIAGFHTIYDVKDVFGGDAYNYIVAANRGVGLVGIGIAAFILGSADAIINVIRKTFSR